MALYTTNLLLGLTWRAENMHGPGSLYGHLLSSELGLHPNALILRDTGRERIACRSYLSKMNARTMVNPSETSISASAKIL